MTKLTLQVSQLRWARIAGSALLVICLSGLLGNNFVVGDVAITASNILAHDREFRVGIWGELLMLNGDIVLAVAFFALLKPVNLPLALLGTLWRSANAVLLGGGVVASLVALDIINAPPQVTGLVEMQRWTNAHQVLDIHGTAMEVGLIFFGLGACVHAWLFWKARFIPRLLSGAYVAVALLIVASFSTAIVFPFVDAVIEPWSIIPDFIVELAVALWLLIRGVDSSGLQEA